MSSIYLSKDIRKGAILVFESLITFLISGLIGSLFVIYFDNYLLALMTTGSIAGLILSILYNETDKVKRYVMAGLFGMLISLVLSFGLVEGFAFLFPKLGNYFEATPIPDIMAVMIMGFIYGGTFGLVVYERSKIMPFAVSCAIIGLPTGYLVALLNKDIMIRTFINSYVGLFSKVDLNYILVTMGLGLGIGFGKWLSIDRK